MSFNPNDPGSMEDLLRKTMGFSFGGMGGKTLPINILRQMQLQMLKTIKGNVDAQVKQLEALLGNAGMGTGASTGSGIPNQSGQQYSDDMNPFIILGVDQSDNQDIIKTAWKKKSRECHPDRGGTNEQQMKVNAAYKTICLMYNWHE